MNNTTSNEDRMIESATTKAMQLVEDTGCLPSFSETFTPVRVVNLMATCLPSFAQMPEESLA